MRVLITGANGFVGRAVSTCLAERGWSVRAAVRRETALPHLADDVEAVVVRDPDGEADWQAAVRGMDAVVHLIARTHQASDGGLASLSMYRETNVGITQRLATACLLTGPMRFVFLSSVKAVGERSFGAPLTEGTRCRPEDAYGISKREAEVWLTTRARDRGLEATILRPPLVYGAGVRANFLRLMKLVDRGAPLPLAGVRNRRSMIFVENLADAVVAVLTSPQATDETFFCADPEPLSTPELVRELATLMGRRARLVPVPTRILELGGRIARREEEVARLVGSLQVSTDLIRKRIGWRPPYKTREGLAATVDWYRTQQQRNLRP